MKNRCRRFLAALLTGALVASLSPVFGAESCAHSYESAVETPAKALTNGVKRNTCTLCGDTFTEVIPMTRSLKILAIGNSFSVDAMEHLYGIAKDGGVENVLLGNLYIGGCSLATHAKNIAEENNAYTYYKNTSGTWDKTESTSVQTALADEEWDIITVQQASADSGVASTYDPMDKILTFLGKNAPNATVYFHMTWAYQQNSTHSGFAKYQNDQMTMYNAIQSAVDTAVKSNTAIAGIIPSGTAIQNLRTSYIGDTVTRDGYHLSYGLGRYTAALTWYCFFTGAAADTVDWVPEKYTEITADLPAVYEAVTGAITTPYSVTEVTAKEPGKLTDAELIASVGRNIGSYKTLDWVYKLHAYYNTSGSTPNELISAENSSASNLPYFIVSHKFTKEELPVGSVLVLDDGYRYRPEGWIGEGTGATRPTLVSSTVVLVTEEWWGDYTERAFNFAPSTNRAIAIEEATHFRIYVPKFPHLTILTDADTNKDGKIDIQDVLRTLYGFLNGLGPASDMNNNGVIELSDVLKVLRRCLADA